MRTHDGEFILKVPGSIANLGPGFDTLAVAVQLYLTLRVRPGTGKGCSSTSPTCSLRVRTTSNVGCVIWPRATASPFHHWILKSRARFR